MQAALQLYGLVFLLGSLTVAALSDLRRMAAQKDFAEVWGAVTLLSLAYDAHAFAEADALTLALKWVFILGFVFMTLKEHALNITPMDVAAVSAVSSLLTLETIVGFYATILLLRGLLNPVLAKFGEGDAKPFLPVVFTSTAAVTAFVVHMGLT